MLIFLQIFVIFFCRYYQNGINFSLFLNVQNITKFILINFSTNISSNFRGLFAQIEHIFHTYYFLNNLLFGNIIYNIYVKYKQEKIQYNTIFTRNANLILRKRQLNVCFVLKLLFSIPYFLIFP